MAKLITLAILSLFVLLLAMPTVHAQNEELDDTEKAWFQNVCKGKETVVTITFYVQDRLGGTNVTVYEVATASITSTSPTSFGQVRVLDNQLTTGPNNTSQTLGRVQGLITSSDLVNSAFTTNLNFYFTSGKYNGSTISMLGRNQILNTERELAVVGGTGTFRMARGYALTSTYSYDVATSYGVLKYDLYVAYPSKSNLAIEEPSEIRLASD